MGKIDCDVEVSFTQLYDLWKYLRHMYQEEYSEVDMYKLVRVVFPDVECAVDGDFRRVKEIHGCLQWLAWMGLFDGYSMMSKGNDIVKITGVRDTFNPTL